MKQLSKTIEELRDSQLLFNKQPPAFGYLLTCIVLAAMVSAALWATKTPKPYTIEAHGAVTNEHAQTVMCTYTGEITDSIMREGMRYDNSRR